MPAVRKNTRRLLYWQLLFVTLAFTLMVVSSGIFVRNMLINYLKENAENLLTQTQIMIMEEIREAETSMTHIVKDVRDIIMRGGSADDVLKYYNDILAELLKKEKGFVFDSLHGYFEALGNVYITAPQWAVPYDYMATERPWYKAAVEAGGEISITPVYMSLSAGEFRINIAFRIFNDEGGPLGVISMDVPIRRITEFVAGVHLVEGGYGFLADKDFVLIAHYEGDFVTKRMTEISPGFIQIVETMEQGEKFVKVEGYNYEGINSIFYCKQINNGWYLGIMTPINVYYRDLRVFILFLGVLGIVLMLAVNIILIRIDVAKSKAQAAVIQMQKLVEEKNTLANLGNIMNGLDTMIYVTDPATDEILFVNDNMKKHYGIEGEIVGQICYKVLQKGLNEKCSFCPCFQLDAEPNSTVVWEEHSALTNRFYRNVDRYINWPSGKTVHLQHSIDISDLKKHLERQSLMTHISQSFFSTEDIDVLIAKALKATGKFMGIDQILMYVVEENEETCICRNEWINPKLGFPTQVGGIIRMNKDILDIIQKVRKLKLFHVTSDDPDMKKILAPYRRNFQNYILTSVFLGDKLLAVIDFSREGDGKLWEENEINMASYVTNILAGALDKRSAELQLIEAKEAAEQSNRTKGIFLANMSHEIRTPMNAILGISEIKLQDETLSPDMEETLRQIYDSGNLLLNIINDILDFSKIEAGKMEIVPITYDIPSLINDTVQLNLLHYESKPVEFKVDLDENTPLELYGDELRIKQILNNLLSNAFKYTDKGEIKLSVRAEQREDRETVTLVLRVDDTGQGLREDQINRLFDEYTRFNMQTNRAVSGTGLGMSIVKHLVGMMGGEIIVESEAGKGSAFAVRLPQKYVGPAVCGAELADSLRNFRFQSMPISKKAHIAREYMPYGSVLVVDDVASNLFVAKGLLSSYGLRIETAPSGIEAIERTKAGSVYDIVFMDHMMPVMDGMEAVKVMRGMEYTRPIVALTANAVAGQSEIFLANGFDGFISKPIDSRELDAVLKKFVRDQHPEEAAKYKKESLPNQKSANMKTGETRAKLLQVFCRDAEKAVVTLRETAPLRGDDAGDIKLFTTAAHAMKSALANVGETEKSQAAAALEKAGLDGDAEFIAANTEGFIKTLESLIRELSPAAAAAADVTEDAAYLKEQLQIVRTSCEDYDDTAAYAALDRLKEKPWKQETGAALEKIREMLFLHSDFDGAAEQTGKILDR